MAAPSRGAKNTIDQVALPLGDGVKLDFEKLWQTGKDEQIMEMTLTKKTWLDSDLTTDWIFLKFLNENMSWM